VTALFPDGLPPTLDEATDTLREAGLFDDVLDILNEHPDAMDAVQSVPPSGPELLASWSTDGDSWNPVDLAPPGGIADDMQLTVSGHRVTVASTDPSNVDGGTSMVTVTSTTDLENWNTADFTLTPPDGLPETARTWIHPIAVASDDQHWVVRIMIDEIADPTSGASVSQTRYELWSGAWGGKPAMSKTDRQFWMLLATSDGFLDFGQGVTFSPDGQVWTGAAWPAPNVIFQTAAPLGDDVLAITGTVSGEGTPRFESSIVVLDASGSMTDEVEIAELGDDFSVWSSSSSPAFIVSAPEEAQGGGAETTQGAEQAAGRPNLWLLATADAGTWLVEDLGRGPDGSDGPMLAAANGTTVLVGTPGRQPGSDAWQRFSITE
jgi:hypothetical protein